MQQIIIVCPHCKGARNVSIDCVGISCRCGNYFPTVDSLQLEKAEYSYDTVREINKNFVALKDDMERKAYQWKDKQIAKRKKGKIKAHEPMNPDGTMKKKTWGRK